ncbi:MAG: ferredoxin-thioredoxin reductase catalytic domain-containing protein [Thermoproteota archaeon]
MTLEQVRQRAENDARTHGYYLNPDEEFLTSLLEGLRENEERYSYPSCPCGLATGVFELDRDIICPCDYRDPDCEEYGYCYCALYVRKDVFEKRLPIKSIPERRPPEKLTKAYSKETMSFNEKLAKVNNTVTSLSSGAKLEMWYCRQCGYVCFREEPPYVCPICKAKREMFGRLILRISG